MNPSEFARQLTQAIRIIAARKDQRIGHIQDELGYAIGREGGTCIEHWRKGFVPPEAKEVKQLTVAIAERGGFWDREACEAFLRHADYVSSDLLDQLFPAAVQPSQSTESTQLELGAFVVGPPITHPRQFFGRERELQQIFALWRQFPMQHMAIIGPKRSGKTSLLHYVMEITRASPTTLRPGQRTDWLPQPQRYRWVFVHFQLKNMHRRASVLHHILTGLNMPVPTPCTLDAFIDTIRQHLQTPAVILMDEISAGLAAEELDEPFWWCLRALANNYARGNLAFLVAAHDVPMQLACEYGKPSPFFNIFHTLELGPFTEEQAHTLIASAPQPFPPEDVDWIIAQSGCWPSLVQILCQIRLLALQEKRSGGNWQEEGLRQIARYRYLLDV